MGEMGQGEGCVGFNLKRGIRLVCLCLEFGFGFVLGKITQGPYMKQPENPGAAIETFPKCK